MPEFVDLTQEIYHNQPVYHTHQKTAIWTDTSHEEAEEMLSEGMGENEEFTFETRAILLCDHGPTHVDAPYHLHPDGEYVDEMSLDLFHTPGKAIEVTHREPGEYITVDDLDEACDSAGVTIESGDTLLIRTGHYDRTYPDREYVEDYPGLNEAASEWLVEKDIVNFGVDTPSPDTPSDPSYPCHRVCRENRLPHMENLCNIERVVGEDFTFIGFPLAIREGTGSPIRAVAMMDD